MILSNFLMQEGNDILKNKYASILHFKLDNNKRPSYFSTSTPSERTPITTTVDLL
jgi:hypothetical protein